MSEVSSICELLLILFRCSTFYATKALQEIVEELFPLLLSILHMSKSMASWTIPSQAMRLIDRVSALPIQLDRVPGRQHLLSVFREAILMDCIDVTEKAALAGVFQLLTGLVLNASSRREFFAELSLLELILSNYHHLRMANYHLAAFLLVGSQDTESRKKMISCPSFIKVLCCLLQVDEPQTRKVAMAMTTLVASERTGRLRLLTLGGPQLLEAAFQNARNDNTNESSLELIRQLICPDTATLFHENDKLLLPIFEATAMDEHTRIIVAKIIYRLSGIISTHAKGMGRFLEAILAMCSPGNNPKVRSMGAKSLVRQSQVEACNFFLIRTPSAVKAIASLASDENSEVSSIGTKIIGNLVSNPLNHRILTKDASMIEPLTTAVERHASNEAIQALITLADNSKCNEALAKHNNVVATLSKYGLSGSARDKELRRAALQKVVKLVPMM